MIIPVTVAYYAKNPECLWSSSAGKRLEDVIAKELKDCKDGIYELRFLGGISAISQDVRDEARVLLH